MTEVKQFIAGAVNLTGSLSVHELIAGAGQLLAAIPEGGFDTPVRTCALSDVRQIWNEDTGEERVVLIP